MHIVNCSAVASPAVPDTTHRAKGQGSSVQRIKVATPTSDLDTTDVDKDCEAANAVDQPIRAVFARSATSGFRGVPDNNTLQNHPS